MASGKKSLSGASSAYSYPASPNALEIFTEYGLLEKPKTPAVNFLSYMLSKTSLTTQKITHSQIQDVGERIYQRKLSKYEVAKEQAVEEAILQCEEKAAEQLKEALLKSAAKAEKDKKEALEAMKNYYEQLAERISSQRERMEKEQEEKLILRLKDEKNKALKEQWEHSENLKKEAIERVLKEQKRTLRAEAALQREKAIADSLRIAREKFKEKLTNEIEKTKRFCERIAQDEMRKTKEIHQTEVIRLRERIATVERQLEVQMEKMRKAQRDYWEMENEYCHFLDYTSHTEQPSGFLITPKKRLHGKGDSNRDQNVQTRLISLDQGTKTVQTDIQIRDT